jgi:predicted metal-dependent phosphoesterase TrpH
MLGVPAAYRGDSRGYPHAALALRTGTRGLSLGSPRFPRADLFEVDAHPKNQIKERNEVWNNKTREFVLTWSKQKSVSSTVAHGITIFGKGGLLALESISKSAMVIMSCQLLFIDFLPSFCHFFGPLYQFLYTKNHLE